MSTRFPVLEEDKRLHFFSLTNFVEALEAVISEQWLMAAPKLQLRLRQEVKINLVYEAEQLELAAVAEPYYWRGQFLAMRIRAASSADVQKAKRLLQQLVLRPDVAAAHAPRQGGRGDGDRPVGEGAGTDPGVAESPTDPDVKPLPEVAASLQVKVPDPIPMPSGEPPVARIEDDGTWGIPPAPSADSTESKVERLDSWVSGNREDSVELPEIPDEPAPSVPAAAPRPAAAPSPAGAPRPAGAPSPAGAPRPAGAPSPAAVAQAAPKAPHVGRDDAIFGEARAALPEDALMSQFPLRGLGLPIPEGATLYRVLAALAANELSGELEVELGGKPGRIYVKSGTLLGMEPYGGSFDEVFAGHLVSNRLAEAEPIRKAAAEAQAHDKPLALSLYETRALGLDVMGRELKKIKEELLFAMLVPPKEETARYRFHPKPRFGKKFDPVRLHLLGTLTNVVRRILATKYAMDLDPLLEQYRFKYGVMRNNELIPVEILSPNEKEKHAIKYVFNGPNRLHESYGLCLLTRHGTARWAMMLHHFALVEWRDDPVAVAGGETVEEVLDREWRSMEGQDHFARLDVHWGAHPFKYDKALERIVKKYGPEGALSNNSDEARDLCAKIMALARESHAFLKDKRQRRVYRIELQGEQRVKRAAEFLVKQAELHRFRSDWDMAFELVEAAVDMTEHPAFIVLAQQWRKEKGGV